jgi:hypothetical protein
MAFFAWAMRVVYPVKMRAYSVGIGVPILCACSFGLSLDGYFAGDASITDAGIGAAADARAVLDGSNAADGGSAADGSAADGGSDAAGLSLCAQYPNALLCEDFSDPNLEANMSFGKDLNGTGTGSPTLTAEMVDVVSPPRAARITSSAGAVGGALSKSFAVPNGLACDFSFRGGGGQGGYTLAQFSVASGPSMGIVSAGLYSTFGMDSFFVGFGGIETATWKRWRLAVAGSLTAGGANNGKRRQWVEELSPTPGVVAEVFVAESQGLGSVLFNLGIFGGAPKQWSFVFDDVVCSALSQ